MIDPVAKPANYTSDGARSPKLVLSVEPELAGLRLDQALARLLPGESRTRLAGLVEADPGSSRTVCLPGVNPVTR